MAAYDYDPFGNPRSDGTAAGTTDSVTNPVQFAGGYQDSTLAAALGSISGIAYLAAKMWDDAIAAFVGAVAGFVLGRATGKAVESLLSKLGLTMVYRARHYANVVERWVPRSFRVQLQWVVSAVTGLIGAAYDTIATKQTTPVYQNNQPWQGLCTHDCGSTFGTHGYA